MLGIVLAVLVFLQLCWLLGTIFQLLGLTVGGEPI